MLQFDVLTFIFKYYFLMPLRWASVEVAPACVSLFQMHFRNWEILQDGTLRSISWSKAKKWEKWRFGIAFTLRVSNVPEPAVQTNSQRSRWQQFRAETVWKEILSKTWDGRWKPWFLFWIQGFFLSAETFQQFRWEL